jgi:hypothetical protein
MYSREDELRSRLNRFLVRDLRLEPNDYAANLSLASLLNLKSALTDINNTITLKLVLGLVNWIVATFDLDEKAEAELRDRTLRTKPNSNGFDLWLGHPMAFLAEVKCNIPVNGGGKYGAQQRHGIVSDVNALMNGKRQSTMISQGVLKFMAFIDLPAVRSANDHLLKNNPALAKNLIFLQFGQTPMSTDHVHGIYIAVDA